MNLHLHHEPEDSEVYNDYLIDQLKAFNDRHTPQPFHRESIDLFVRDDEGQIWGGMLATVSMDWVEIDILWLDEAVKGQGWGRKLLEWLEGRARELNLVGLCVDTTSFQARPFYEAMGFEVFGQLEDMPRGATTWMLKKVLR